MKRFKKIIDILVIGLAIAVVVVLGERIVKIGNDAREGIYLGQEQEVESNQEIIPAGSGGSAIIDLEMEIDQSLFEQRKDLLALAPKDNIDDEKNNTGETEEVQEETVGEVVEAEKTENNSEDISGGEDSNPEMEAPGEEIGSEPESYISLIENIDYSDSANFKIEIDLSRQRLIVFYKEEILREMICSGGAPDTPTPKGEFTTNQKIEYSWVPRFEMGAYYWIRFFEDYLIHSVPFDENGEMIVEEFEKLGNPASHGCVRLKLEEAKWLFETLPLGVKVLIY